MRNFVRSTGLINTTAKGMLLTGFLLTYIHAGDVPTIDKPKNFDPPTKEEGGILTTLVSSYMAVRNSVRFVYDEVTYFERMYETYDEMTGWFDKNKERVENLFDASTRVFSDPENVFTTLRRMERIFDAVDQLVLVEPRKFDYILSGGEKLVDVAAGRNNAYTGFIIPNTEGVLKYVEALFTSNEGLALPDDEKAKMSKDEQERMSELLWRQREEQLDAKDVPHLEHLLNVYRLGLLRKAEVLRVAVSRGLRPPLGAS